MLRKRLATESTTAGCSRPPSRSSSRRPTLAPVRGTTGPASGSGRTGLVFADTRLLIRQHRQRDGRPAEATLNFTLDVKRKLAGAELSEVDAIAGAQSASLPLVVWSLRRELAGIINEAVPDVHIDDASLLGPTAV